MAILGVFEVEMGVLIAFRVISDDFEPKNGHFGVIL
jgi:hypothetical protein